MRVDIFDALADPVRRSLLVEMALGPRRVVDLADSRPISRPAVSRHLRVLLETGAVTVVERGRERHYALDTDALEPVLSFVTSLGSPPAPVVGDRELDALETEVRRAVRDRRRPSTTPLHDRAHEETA